MTASLSFAHVPEIRSELAEACRSAWSRIGGPGTWWTGEERVAIASEARAARGGCALCRERKEAVSPYWVAGSHAENSPLGGAEVDAVHRVATDPGRLTKRWLDELVDGGVTVEQYVEIVGLIATVVAVDSLCSGIGLDPPELPSALAGEQSRVRPPSVAVRAWVPHAAGTPGFVAASLSLVPDENRAFERLKAVMYPLRRGEAAESLPSPALTQTQIELVATVASAANKCLVCTGGHALRLGASLPPEVKLDLEALVAFDDVARADAASANVPAGPLLARLARAVAAGDGRDLSEARRTVTDEVGSAALVDAVAVAALYNGQNLALQATGIDAHSWTRAKGDVKNLLASGFPRVRRQSG